MGKKRKKWSQGKRNWIYAISLAIICSILLVVIVYNMDKKNEVEVLEKKLSSCQRANEHYSEMNQVIATTKKVINPMMNIAQDRGVDDLPKYKKFFKKDIYRAIRQGNKAILSSGVEVFSEDTTFSYFTSKNIKVYPGFILKSNGKIKSITTMTRFIAVYDKGKEVEMIMELEFFRGKQGWQINSIPKFSTVENLPTTISEKAK